jgi:ATP-dependent Lhr-like helicase
LPTDACRAIDYLGPPPHPTTALAALAEPLRRWFAARFGAPTPAQRLAWPAVAAGQNLLLCAPTGGGKTLAAFLPIVGRLLEEPPRFSRSVRCLYVAPLKALGNDACHNLGEHLRDLQPVAAPDREPLRVGLRTGDTSAGARRELPSQPPDLLLTTPESLAVLLSQPWAADLFAELGWVVVDEIHALAASKRGADLSLGLERLDALARGGLQRIGLSATCAPLATAARFLVGEGRPCTVALAGEDSPLHLTVEPLAGGSAADGDGGGTTFHPRPAGFVARLLDRLEPELTRNRTTLIFTNVRSLAERLVWALRRRRPDWSERVAVHHSALSADRRRDVERRLKEGDLRVVASSTSLELGIDVGTVDGVILVHPPGGVVRLLQRVGRAGHGPGRERRGLVLTSTAAELLEAAVTAASGRSGQAEALRTAHHPLDVLCQQLLGMAAQQAWTADEAFALVRRAYPYRDLSRADFDGCLDYLSGRRGNGEAWLPARLRWDDDLFLIRDERTARILRRNVGTIITEEPRPVLLSEPRGQPPGGAADEDAGPCDASPLGEVEETFADRLEPGDRFLLDGRCLEYRRSDGPALLVDEVVGRPRVPRWSGEGWPLSRELARRLYALRVQAAEALRDGPGALADLLRHDYGLEGAAVADLACYFQRQECLSEIPDARVCLVEAVPGDAGVDYYVHTPLHRGANDALARVVVHRLAARPGGRAVVSLVADLGFALFWRGGGDLTPADLRALLAADRFEADLDAALAASETLRERFRRVALTGLMLLRNPIGRRRRVGGRDWPERRLFDKVRREEPDFVLLRQALREVRDECCDSDAARGFVLDLPRRTLTWRPLAQVSPFAENWTQASLGVGEVVESPDEALERLHAALTGN